MSLIDPEQRWWRRKRPLQRLSIVFWTVVFLVAVLTGWCLEQYLAGAVWQSWGGTSRLVGTGDVSEGMRALTNVTLVLLPVLIFLAAAVDFTLHHRGGREIDVLLCGLFGIPVTGLGLGALGSGILHGRFSLLWLGVLLVGLAILAIVPLSRRMQRRRRLLQEHIRFHGRRTDAIVTKRDIRVINSLSFYYVVTLKYTDAEGRERWLRRRMPQTMISREGHVELGERFPLSYDPNHPGRRSAIFVDLSRRAPEPLRDANSLSKKPGRRWKPMRPAGS